MSHRKEFASWHIDIRTLFLRSVMLLLLTSCGGNGSVKDGKLVETMGKTIESNDYTAIYVGAHWCGPCSRVFENKMAPIIDANYDKLGCITIFFDSGNKVKNNENIMRYSPVILPSVGGIVDKVTANRILKKVFQNYDDVNYMPIMILCDNEGKIINYIDGQYVQFDKRYLESVFF